MPYITHIATCNNEAVANAIAFALYTRFGLTINQYESQTTEGLWYVVIKTDKELTKREWNKYHDFTSVAECAASSVKRHYVKAMNQNA